MKLSKHILRNVLIQVGMGLTALAFGWHLGSAVSAQASRPALGQTTQGKPPALRIRVKPATRGLMTLVPKMQSDARLARGGRVGCGNGSYRIITKSGERTIASGLDPIHVFGARIHLQDIHALLAAKEEANRTGTGPMAKNVEDLMIVCYGILQRVGDASTIPHARRLLDANKSSTREWGAQILWSIGYRNDACQPAIKRIRIPMDKRELLELGNRCFGKNTKIPDWISFVKKMVR